VNYGLSQLFLGKRVSAQQTFEKLLASDPSEYYDLFWAVAAAYAEMDEHVIALKFYTPLLTYEATDAAPLWTLMARSYRASGELRRAAELYEKVFESMHDAESCCALTEIYSELEAHEKGIELVRKFLDWRQQQKTRAAEQETAQVQLTEEGSLLFLLLVSFNLSYFSHAFAEVRVTARMSRFYFQIGQYETFVEIVQPVIADPDYRFHRRRRRIKTKKPAMDDEDAQQDPEVYIPDAPAEPTRHNILEIIGVDDYLYLFVATVRSLVWLRRPTEAHQVMKVCFVYIMTEGPDNLIPKETQRQLRYFAGQVALRAGDNSRADRHFRDLILKDPFSPFCPIPILESSQTNDYITNLDTSLWNHFFIASQRMDAPLISSRFAMRVAEKNPECLSARLMVGHFHHLARSHRVALAEYLPSYLRFPNNPTVTLSIGLAYLNQAMSRTLGDRNYTVMQAFAFIFRYGDLTGWTQEALYNVGRAFHHLDLLPFAIHMYERALQASPLREKMQSLSMQTGHPRPDDAMDVDDASGQNHRDELARIEGEDLCKEIAHNLALIYRRSGSPQLARMIMAQYIVV
jgi:tetratricopeptide (TPR) repeat protein